MKILVTGANGYLGQGIVKAILETGNQVVATDLTTENIDKRAMRVNADLFQIEDPYVFFKKPDVLLHLAWRDGFIHYSNAHLEDLPKHFEFIKKMVETDLQTVAVMGSMHEIGFYEGSIDENTACRPESFYGIAKNALRDTTKILAKQNNKNFQWLRGYYIVGNSTFGSSIFSKITKAANMGQKTFPFTLGLNQFDFLDYDDFCTQVAVAVSQSKINGIINICSGRPEKLSDRVERFIKENDYDIKLEYGAFPDRPYDSKAVWGNSQKIEQILEQSSKIQK